MENYDILHRNGSLTNLQMLH